MPCRSCGGGSACASAVPSYNTRVELCWGLGRYWFDDARTIAQECNTVRPGCVVALSDGTVVWETGTNILRANGHGFWACVPFPADGYVDAIGRTLPAGQDTPYAPDAIGPDAAVCLRPHSNAFADVLELTGEVWRLSNADAFDVQLLGDRRAIWREKGPDPHRLHARGLSPAPATPDGDYAWSRLIQKPDGAWGLLYQSETGGALVFDGRIIADGVAFFRPDAAFLGDVLHVAWALDQSEAFGPELAFTPAQFAALPLIADRLHPAPEPPDPEPPEPEPPDPEPTPEPPDPEPPRPVPLFVPAFLFEVSMEAVPCVLRMGSFYAQIQAAQAGKGPFGWYPVGFTKDRHDAACAFTRSSPDGERILLRHDGTQAALGADATEFIAGGNVCAQLYGKPNVTEADWGGYEAWWGWELDQERRIVLVEYDREDGLSTSLCLTVEDR